MGARSQAAAGERLRYGLYACSLGRLLVAASPRGVCQVRFGDDDRALTAALARELPFAVLARDDAGLSVWSEALVRYVDGRSSRLEIPLDVRGSRFQQRVWAALRAIPRGATRSYGELAEQLGNPGAARAVARACAANPTAVAIPCHRVVPLRGGAGGYRWGAERKRALLEREGVLDDSREAERREAAPAASSSQSWVAA
jgi:AraC family transcriptional regulator of adaptative response/methylated-DNA-[protein]-cysteine methyltransferase